MSSNFPISVEDSAQSVEYSTDMVERIGQARLQHFYIDEHRIAQGLTWEQLAGRVFYGGKEGVATNTVWRWNDEQKRLRPAKAAAIANALGLPNVEALTQPPRPKDAKPPRPSLDKMLENTPDEVFDDIAGVVERMLRRAG